MDNCDILKKYAGIAIGYILEIRSNPRKWTVFLNSACKIGPESVGKPLTFLKGSWNAGQCYQWVIIQNQTVILQI